MYLQAYLPLYLKISAVVVGPMSKSWTNRIRVSAGSIYRPVQRRVSHIRKTHKIIGNAIGCSNEKAHETMGIN
jgi:hypothetical protein